MTPVDWTEKLTGSFVLPADVQLLPVTSLTMELRNDLQVAQDDWAIGRAQSRTRAKIIDEESALLLKEFTKPSTIVEAVRRFSESRQVDPETTLEQAFPMLRRLLDGRLLVPVDSSDVIPIKPSLALGSSVGGALVVACIQLIEDKEVYEVRTASEERAALKIVRPGRSNERVYQEFERESRILELLAGRSAPLLLSRGLHESRPFLLLNWCDGTNVAMVAQHIRRREGAESRRLLLDLCCRILEAYSKLHAIGVIHGDVHPGNLLVSQDGPPTIVDFGLARVDTIGDDLFHAPRAGVEAFIDPELALARLRGALPPSSNRSGEQYALAALCYFILTSRNYLKFSAEQSEALTQIVKQPVASFAEWGLADWPEVEEVLAKALSKRPSERYSNLGQMTDRLRQITDQCSRDSASHKGSSKSSAFRLLDRVVKKSRREGDLFQKGFPTTPKCSLNFGESGLAYAIYRIACAQEDSALLSLADSWSTSSIQHIRQHDAFINRQIGLTEQTIGGVSPYHTATGVFCVQALISDAMGDLVSLQEAVDNFVRFASTATARENLDLTLGQTGVILACALLNDVLANGMNVDKQPLLTLGDSVMRTVWDGVRSIETSGDGVTLLGPWTAHGWAGILYATLCWKKSSETELPEDYEKRIGELAESMETIGFEGRNAPGVTLRSGWCNGTAGLVHLWLLAAQAFGEAKYWRLAEAAAQTTWDRPSEGLGSLCCGLAGEAYALLNMYRSTGDAEWLRRARVRTEQASEAMAPGILPVEMENSLYKGEVGVAVLACDLLRPEESYMPFFERSCR